MMAGVSICIDNLRNNTLASSRIAKGVLSAADTYTWEKAGVGVGGKVQKVAYAYNGTLPCWK